MGLMEYDVAQKIVEQLEKFPEDFMQTKLKLGDKTKQISLLDGIYPEELISEWKEMGKAIDLADGESKSGYVAKKNIHKKPKIAQASGTEYPDVLFSGAINPTQMVTKGGTPYTIWAWFTFGFIAISKLDGFKYRLRLQVRDSLNGQEVMQAIKSSLNKSHLWSIKNSTHMSIETKGQYMPTALADIFKACVLYSNLIGDTTNFHFLECNTKL